MITVSLVTVIGVALYIILLCIQQWLKFHSDNIKRLTEEDEKIDSSNDADSLLRRFDELRNK